MYCATDASLAALLQLSEAEWQKYKAEKDELQRKRWV